jgi:hypothetical protein
MAKISATTVKRTGLVAIGIWFITVIGFLVLMTAIEPTISQPWVRPLANGLVTLIGGLVMFVTCLVYSIAVWSMSADEHYDMFVSFWIFRKSSQNILSKPYLHWQNRILTLLGLLMGAVLIIFGITELVTVVTNLPN